MTLGDILLLHLRGLALRCPRCGSGGLFRRWMEMVPECPLCQLRFEHEEGYWVGAMIYNIVVTELVFVAVMVAVVIATWPDLPVWPLVGAGVLLNLIFPIAFYPVSKTLWVATDLAFFHPLRPWRR